MKVQLESTEKIVDLNGVPARVWEGKSASGVPCFAFVTRIAVREEADLSEFETQLQPHRAPSPDVSAIPASLLL